MNGNNYKPMYSRPDEGRKPSRSETLTDRKQRFDALNTWVQARGGWVVSIPGDPEVRIEVLEGSSVPDGLREMGYDIKSMGAAERMVHMAVEEKFVRAPNGTLVSLTPGSTRSVVETRQHAGLVTVLRYGFRMP